MARRLAGSRLVIASHNAGKLREFEALLAPCGVTAVAAAAFGLAAPEETGATFAENATLKAQAAAVGSGLPALADDSGLVVPALGGAPGIRSARWAGPDGDFTAAMARLNRALGPAADRRAHFTAALALAWPDDHVECFEGHVHGTLLWPPRGGLGFGYDPMFLPAGETLTFGQMEPAKKHRISHRALAFRQLLHACLAA